MNAISSDTAKAFVEAVESSSPLLLIGRLISQLKESGCEDQELCDKLISLRDFYTHPCSPFVDSTNYLDICRELESHIERIQLKSRASESDSLNFSLSVRDLDNWDRMSDQEKASITQKWDVYRREGLAFVLVACGRLVLKSHIQILDALPGIYHGGVWVINAYVYRTQLEKCPSNFSMKVDGFGVVWITYPQTQYNVPSSNGT